MATTPRHHLVPQFLLRWFADGDGKLIMVKRDDLDASFPSTVNNACNEAGYYRIETEDLEPGYRDGHDPEALEKLLSVFESRAEQAIRHLLDDTPPWTDEDRYHLAHFTALQYVRGWHFRKQLDELGTLAMRREMLADRPSLERSAKRFLRERGEPATQKAVAEFIQRAYGSGGPRLVLGKSHAIQTTFRFAMETLVPMLFTRPLRLVHFAEDAPLLTSDSPVVTWAPGTPASRVVALSDAATITLPLTPSLALSFAVRGHDAIGTAGATRARQINTAAADLADRWIYYHPDTAPLAGLVIPSERPHWQDERLAARVDEGGNYRELWWSVQR